MKHTQIVALMLVAGSTMAVLSACSQERTTASDSSRGYYDSAGNWRDGHAGRGYYDSNGVWRSDENRSYTRRTDSSGYYDSNGVWRGSSATSSVSVATPSGGYYDSTGTWRPSTAQQNTAGSYDSNGVWQSGATASAANRPDPHATDRGAPIGGGAMTDNRSTASTSGGYYDSNGTWRASTTQQSASGYYDSNGVWQSGAAASASNRLDPHATDRGAPAGQAGSVTYTQGTAAAVGLENRPDPHATFRGPPVGGGAVADNRSASGGYYDSNGVWRSTPSDASVTDSRMADKRNGYYDSKGAWQTAKSDASVSVDSNRADGYYDSNGVWRSGRGDARVTAPGGFYDSNGVWRSDAQASLRTDNRPDAHATFRGPPAGGGSPTDTPMSSDGVRVVGGNPNVSTGYYDSNGVWHSVGPAGVVNIPIGTSTSRVYGPAIVQGNRAWQDRSSYAQSESGYYDSNGVWQSSVRDDRSYAQVNTGRDGYGQNNKNAHGNANTQTNGTDRNGYAADNRTAATRSADMAANWGGKPGEQVRTMTAKYGQPDEVTDSCVVWKDKGGFECIKVFKEEVDHKWPVAHTDFLEHAVAYKVPVDKVGELAKFDGSVYVDITKGCLAAKCDKESHNLLALNLANDICTGKKTATEARDYFSRAIADEMAGKSDPYLERLAFTPASRGTAGNPGSKHEAGSVNQTPKDADRTKADREASERDAMNRPNDADRDRMNKDRNR